MQSIAESYIGRNVFLLRQWKKLLSEGVKTREAAKIISETNEGVSEGLINALVYNKNYPYAAAAWTVIEKEDAEKRNMASATGTVADEECT